MVKLLNKKKILIAFIYIVTISIIFGCSAKIEKENLSVAKKDTLRVSNKKKEFAKQLFIDASLLDLEGKYAEAILDYQEALKLDPSSGIHYALGKDYLRLNKLYSALEHGKKAVDLEPDNVEYLTMLGTIYNLSNQKDSAETIFKNILSIDSLNVNALYNLGNIYEKEQPVKALKAYNKIIDITGNEWNVLLKIAAINERLGKVEETIKTAEHLLEMNPSSLTLKKILIESYILNGKYEAALKLADETIEIFPDDLSLIEQKGNAYVKMGEWEKGAAEFKKIITKKDIPFATKMKIGSAFYGEAINDSSVVPYALDILTQIDKDSADWQINAFMGELNNKAGNDSLSLYYFKKSIDLAKLNSELRIRLGQLLFEKGNYKIAAEEMKKAVVKFPKSYPINFILGLSLAQMDSHKVALPYLKKAVELAPNDLNTTLAYSFSLDQVDQDDEALEYLKRALRIDPKNVQALGMMGLIYDGRKDYAKSDSIYSIAVGIDSTDIMIMNNYAYSLAERGIALDRALKMVQKAIDKEPNNSSYLDTIGWVYFKLKNYEKAIYYIKRALEEDEGNSTLLDHLGDVYFKMGKKELALEMWQNALEKDSSNVEIKRKIKKGIE